MKRLLFAMLPVFLPFLHGEEAPETLRESVRGDTGKWNDTATLRHAPPLATKPESLSLDQWADLLAEEPRATTPADENWLIFRSRQLDDNDRVRVEKMEREGNLFTIVMNEAIWQGYYNKTFTYYEVLALNLGTLPAGDYTVKWIIRPRVFRLFDGDGRPQTRNGNPQRNGPKDETEGKGEPVELNLAFTVRLRP